MTESKLIDALTDYTRKTGQNPQCIFLTPDDWRSLAGEMYPYGPNWMRLGLSQYAGLPFQFIPYKQEWFVGPLPKIVTELKDDENAALRVLSMSFAQVVRCLRPVLPGQHTWNFASVDMCFQTLFDAERRAHKFWDQIDPFDVFKRAAAGQTYILPHHSPFTRLVNWVQENDITLVGHEKSDTFRIIYPMKTLPEQGNMFLADEEAYDQPANCAKH